MIDKVLSTLGLAKKAGKISSGTNLVSTFIRSEKKPVLVLLAQDASKNTKKLITSASLHHNVDLVSTAYTMDQFSDAIGASNYISCIAVFDRDFANLIKSKLVESDNYLPKQEV